MVRFLVFWRPTPGDSWNDPVERVESVPFYMTAVAPIYGGAWDSLYVVGVGSARETVVEKWRIVVTPSTGTPPSAPSVTVEKTNELTDPALTHLRAAAASPKATS
jgi:hypothetical protein